MKIEKVLDKYGDFDGKYSITSPFFQDTRFISVNTYAQEKLRLTSDELLWYVLDQLEDLKTRNRLLSNERDEIQAFNISRAFNMSKLIERIKKLEGTNNENTSP
jgi:hypothetical protein